MQAMYFYIVNPAAGDGGYDQLQQRLKSRLQQLEIDGEFSKTLEPEDAAKITRTLLKRGAKTIVVIGDDATLNDVITTVNTAGKHSVAVGFIPLAKTSLLGAHLGIENWQHACELLAERRLQTFNVIHINDNSFIHSCTITAPNPEAPSHFLAEIDGEYRVRGQAQSLEVYNQKLLNSSLPNRLLLQLLEPPPSSWRRLWQRRPSPAVRSQLHGRVAIVEFDAPATAVIDGRKLQDDMFRIRLSQTPIKLITDKQRQGFDEQPSHLLQSSGG